MLTPDPTRADTTWFVNARFGMFIHWGLYALAARHEWVKHREEMDDAAYQKYFDHFNPDLYDPREWARIAREAGMKYVVLTTKHHDGFCWWDSALTDYKSTRTPYGQDLLRPFVDAFRAEGLRIGFYHSLIDWHHPDFPIDAVHPQRNHPDAHKLNEQRDIRKYAAYLHGQVRELLTQYGPVDIMWFDFSYPEREYRGLRGKGRDDWQSASLLQMVRELQPNVIVNNRLDLPPESVDFYTPEQYQPRGWFNVNGKPVVWETCQTFSGSWGYYRDEHTWKSPEQLIQLLINSVSTGGNLLLNVGPTARGTFDERAVNALAVYRDWMREHARSIYGCTMSQFVAPPDCRFTQQDQRLYLHVFAWPFRHLHLEDLADKVAYAQLLNDASEIKMLTFDPRAPQQNTRLSGLPPNTLTLELPVRKPNVVVPVIELFLKEG